MYKPKATTYSVSGTVTPAFDSTDMSAITSNPSKTKYEMITKLSTTTKLKDSEATVAATKSTTTNSASTTEGKIYTYFVLFI